MRLTALLACALALAACAHAAPPAPAPAETVDYRCRSDDDCAVKDVGNCCGYYPACVNRTSPTFPERVKAECAKQHMAGVCGFPVIEGCRCVEGRCRERRAGAAQER